MRAYSGIPFLVEKRVLLCYTSVRVCIHTDLVDAEMEYRNKKYIGLNNEICIFPAFWCPVHQVWLSEKDVKKKCLHKKSFDMMEESACKSLQLKNDKYVFDKKLMKRFRK